jgi:hypothetical protein
VPTLTRKTNRLDRSQRKSLVSPTAPSLASSVYSLCQNTWQTATAEVPDISEWRRVAVLAARAKLQTLWVTLGANHLRALRF